MGEWRGGSRFSERAAIRDACNLRMSGRPQRLIISSCVPPRFGRLANENAIRWLPLGTLYLTDPERLAS